MRWLTLAILLLIAVRVLPQTNMSGDKKPSYEGQKIASVDLIATPSINADQFRPLLQEHAGDMYSEEVVEASVRALEETHAFSKVDVQVDLDPAGLKLRFVLEPAYYIGLLEFPGALKAFSYTRLLQVVNLGDQMPFLQSQVPDSETALKKFLVDHGFFQAEVHTEVAFDDQNQLANLTYYVQLGKRARLGRVVIMGAPEAVDRRLERTVRSLRARLTGALLKPGKPYGPTRIKLAVSLIKKELGKEHHPASRVQVNPPTYHADTNRADISISVDEGPEVDIRVVGARLSWLPFLSSRQQRKLIPIYEENAVDPDLVAEGERNLANFFQRKGYFNVKVKTDFQQQNERVLLVYEIDKGRKHAVEEIAFRGNHSLESDDLLMQVAIKKHRPFLSRGSFSNKLLRTSVTNIENFYKDNGFEDVKVSSQVVNHDRKLYVTFEVTEGTRTVVNSLKVEGNKSIPLAQLRPAQGFQLEEGKPFSPRRLSDDRNKIAAKYLDRGYLNCEVKTLMSRHPEDPHQVNITYQISEQQQVRISHVLYMGLKHTKSDLVRISTNLAPEEPLSEGRLLQGESKLYDLGIFDWASIGPRREITDQSEEEALVKVHEAKRNSITYGFGLEISRRGGNVPSGTVAVPGLPTIPLPGAKIVPSGQTFVSPRGSVEFTRRNMRGEGETAAISVLAARLDQRLVLTYTVPHFHRSSWQALTSLSAERTTENPLFEARLTDASLQFQRFLDSRKTLQLQLRYDFNRTKLTQLLVPELVLPSDRNVDLSYLSGTLIRDTRDKPLDAHRGVYQTLDFRLVPKAFGSSANFARLFLQDAHYKPLGRVIFANSIRLGLSAPFAGSDVPTSQRFFAGGGTTLRGFPINEAGPIRYVPFCLSGQTTNCPQVPVPIGGNQLFVFNSELRFPIPIMDNLGGVVFYDGGNVYRRINFADFLNHYTNTVGIGLRYATPIGPVRIDVGRNVNPVPGISATQFVITLGQAF